MDGDHWRWSRPSASFLTAFVSDDSGGRGLSLIPSDAVTLEIKRPKTQKWCHGAFPALTFLPTGPGERSSVGGRAAPVKSCPSSGCSIRAASASWLLMPALYPDGGPRAIKGPMAGRAPQRPALSLESKANYRPDVSAEPLQQLRLPRVLNLRSDPFERAQATTGSSSTHSCLCRHKRSWRSTSRAFATFRHASGPAASRFEQAYSAREGSRRHNEGPGALRRDRRCGSPITPIFAVSVVRFRPWAPHRVRLCSPASANDRLSK